MVSMWAVVTFKRVGFRPDWMDPPPRPHWVVVTGIDDDDCVNLIREAVRDITHPITEEKSSVEIVYPLDSCGSEWTSSTNRGIEVCREYVPCFEPTYWHFVAEHGLPSSDKDRWTCDGGNGHGPCGKYSQWGHGKCSEGHLIVAAED